MSERDLSRVVWRKSSRSSSNGGACVEVATTAEPMHLARDSKNPSGPALAFTPVEWTAFLNRVKKGSFDLP